MALETLKEAAGRANFFVHAALIVSQEIRCKKGDFKDMPLDQRSALYALTMIFATIAVVSYPISVPLAAAIEKYRPTPQYRKLPRS